MSMDNLKIAIEESVKEAFGDNAKYILRRLGSSGRSSTSSFGPRKTRPTRSYPISYDQRLSKLWRKPDGCMSIS